RARPRCYPRNARCWRAAAGHLRAVRLTAGPVPNDLQAPGLLRSRRRGPAAASAARWLASFAGADAGLWVGAARLLVAPARALQARPAVVWPWPWSATATRRQFCSP